MSRLANTLPSGFVRIHRSAIVSVPHVRETRDLPNRELEVVLDTGARLRASRTHADALRRALGALATHH